MAVAAQEVVREGLSPEKIGQKLRRMTRHVKNAVVEAVETGE
jgi:hypothetical protein